jgi:hypothetical protein
MAVCAGVESRRHDRRVSNACLRHFRTRNEMEASRQQAVGGRLRLLSQGVKRQEAPQSLCSSGTSSRGARIFGRRLHSAMPRLFTNGEKSPKEEMTRRPDN